MRTRTIFAVAALALLALELSACGGSASTQSDTGDAASACNTLANDGAPVTLRVAVGQAPAPRGGSITDGTYVLTDAVRYTGSSGTKGGGSTLRMTVRIIGSAAEIADGDQRASAKFSTSGTQLVATDTCPDNHTQTLGYTATNSALTVISHDSGASVVEVFSKE